MKQFVGVCRPHKPENDLAAVLMQLSGGQIPSRVICTGHSLGGALATLGRHSDAPLPLSAIACKHLLHILLWAKQRCQLQTCALSGLASQLQAWEYIAASALLAGTGQSVSSATQAAIVSSICHA